MQTEKGRKALRVTFFFMPFLYGLFREYGAILAGIVMCLLAISIIMEEASYHLCGSPCIWILTGVLLCYGIVSIYGIAKGMAFLGFTKRIPLLFWFILLAQCRKEKREDLLELLPLMGAAMTVLSALGFLIPYLHDYLFTENRMAGCFQYANTFALFLLLGMIGLLYKEEKGWKDWSCFVILAFGILCSGSRIVFILTMLCLIIRIIEKKAWKGLIALGAGVVLLGGATAVVPTLKYTVGRIFTTSLHSSTLLGRFLYVQDALGLLKKYPFGMGAYGYSYVNGSVATGYYQVQYVHNDFLQIGLDVGILPMLAKIGVTIWGICKCKKGRNRMWLAVFAIHSLFEFNLEFTFMSMLFCLFLPIWDAKKSFAVHTKEKIIAIVIGVGYIIAMLPFGVSSFYYYADNYNAALSWYPYYTKARENYAKILEDELETVEQLDELAMLSNQLLSQNAYSRVGYQIRAAECYYQQRYEEMIQNEDKTIALCPYYTEEYETYAQYLLFAINTCMEQKDEESLNICMEKLLGLPEEMKQYKRKMSSFGKQIKDQPNFTLSKETAKQIEQYRKVWRE